MNNRIIHTIVLTFTILVSVARAATFTVTTTASNGAGSFSQAMRDADASADLANTIRFNIPGAGPHYIAPPAGGFPLVTKDNTTIDGYSQPGSSVNTRPITQTNNAVIKIVLDARTSANFRDMAYVYYGSQTVSDPVINNSAMYVGVDVPRERGGYDPSENGDTGHTPYAPGEVAILAIYRATNVTVKGVAILGDGSGSEYAIAVAQDYGLDTAVNDRYNYPQGTSKGFHLSGCWIGVDPGTGAEHPSGAALAAFRHRDNGTGGTRPELPNLENFSIGVKAGSANPRAEFNVLNALGLTIAAEGMRCRVAGNQFFGAQSEIGRYNDTQVPSIVFGTDGDGVNDAEEGNLFPATSPAFYGTSDKVFVIAGNTFGLARDGTRPNTGTFAASSFSFNNRTKLRFGSNMDGLNDGLEANTLYDTFGIAPDTANAPDDNAWLLMRGNTLVNNATLPLDESIGLNLYNKFIDTTGANPITPVISAVTTASLSGSCGIPLPGVAKVVVDIYESDLEGDTNNVPQGKVYRGSLADNSAADSNPAVGAFTFNIASLGISSGTKLTINANYLKADAAPTIGSIVRSDGNTMLTFSGGTGPYNVLRASTVNGSYTGFATAASSPAVFADAATMSFYRVGTPVGVAGGQTSPFAPSVTIP